MLPTHASPISPGEMLQHFIEECGLSQVRLAKHLGWSKGRVNELVKGKRAFTHETALCLGDAFGNSPEFWMNVQHSWDMWHAMRTHTPRPKIEFSEAG